HFREVAGRGTANYSGIGVRADAAEPDRRAMGDDRRRMRRVGSAESCDTLIRNVNIFVLGHRGAAPWLGLNWCDHLSRGIGGREHRTARKTGGRRLCRTLAAGTQGAWQCK